MPQRASTFICHRKILYIFQFHESSTYAHFYLNIIVDVTLGRVYKWSSVWNVNDNFNLCMNLTFEGQEYSKICESIVEVKLTHKLLKII